jgi:hypothetical protein
MSKITECIDQVTDAINLTGEYACAALDLGALIITTMFMLPFWCIRKLTVNSVKILILLLILAVPAAAQTIDEMKTCVEYLADDAREGRWPGSEGMKEAQNYIRKQCKDRGLPTYTQEVSTRGTKCLNVITTIPGFSEDRIVVGAHLDHIGKSRRGRVYNGADDNASGCAVALMLAGQLAKGPKPGCTIEIQWYTGEEEGLTGSKAYVRSPLAPLKCYKFMLNLDMVGRLKKPGLYGEGFKFDDVLEPLYKKYPFASKITLMGSTSGSDHVSWRDAGVPVLMLHTGLHRDYHEPSDDVNKINFRGLVDICHYALDIVRGVDQKLIPHKPANVSYILR